MTSKTDLKQCLVSRARSDTDAVTGSKLVAAYVSDCVREDRRKRPLQKIGDVLDEFFDALRAD